MKIDLRCPKCKGASGEIVIAVRYGTVKNTDGARYMGDLNIPAFRCDCGHIRIFRDEIPNYYFLDSVRVEPE